MAKIILFFILRYFFMQIEKYALLADMMLSRRQSVLIAGEPGVGKSSIIEVRL